MVGKRFTTSSEFSIAKACLVLIGTDMFPDVMVDGSVTNFKLDRDSARIEDMTYRVTLATADRAFDIKKNPLSLYYVTNDVSTEVYVMKEVCMYRRDKKDLTPDDIEDMRYVVKSKKHMIHVHVDAAEEFEVLKLLLRYGCKGIVSFKYKDVEKIKKMVMFTIDSSYAAIEKKVSALKEEIVEELKEFGPSSIAIDRFRQDIVMKSDGKRLMIEKKIKKTVVSIFFEEEADGMACHCNIGVEGMKMLSSNMRDYLTGKSPLDLLMLKPFVDDVISEAMERYGL